MFFFWGFNILCLFFNCSDWNDSIMIFKFYVIDLSHRKCCNEKYFSVFFCPLTMLMMLYFCPLDIFNILCVLGGGVGGWWTKWWISFIPAPGFLVICRNMSPYQDCTSISLHFSLLLWFAWLFGGLCISDVKSYHRIYGVFYHLNCSRNAKDHWFPIPSPAPHLSIEWVELNKIYRVVFSGIDVS